MNSGTPATHSLTPNSEEGEQDISPSDQDKTPYDATTRLWRSEEEEDKPSPSQTGSLNFNTRVASILFPVLEDTIA